MSWTVAKGGDNGAPVIVSIDEQYRDLGSRAGRDTCIAIRVLGPAMLQSVENRTAFAQSLEPFLRQCDGVLVAGITRTQPISYTFITYCQSNHPDPDGVPIPEPLRANSSVTIRLDPGWDEYESWLPKPPAGFNKVPHFFEKLRWHFGYKVQGIMQKLKSPKR
jgi:hypothetical protein